MNKEQTTIEREAKLWWDGLEFETKRSLAAQYFGVSSPDSLNYKGWELIYKAEHPTAPTVEIKEDSSSEVPELLHEGNGTIVMAELKGRIFMTVNKDFVKYADFIVQHSNNYSKLLEDNKLLRDALQWMITMYQLSSDYKNLSPSWQQKTNEAIAVLEQTK